MASEFGKYFADPLKHIASKVQHPVQKTTKSEPLEENKGEAKRKKKARQKVHKQNAKQAIEDRIETGMKGSKFRWINEQLYTHKSRESYKLFKENKELFTDYHEGYEKMVAKWPKNPLDLIIKELKKEKYADKTVADLGCGTGRLGKDLKGRKVLSYDLVSSSPEIIACDIAKVILYFIL